MVVPALGVYGPELFPTSLRGRANGGISILGVTGSVLGLAIAGALSDRWNGLGPALALLAIGPLLMAVLVLVQVPRDRAPRARGPQPRGPARSHRRPSAA